MLRDLLYFATDSCANCFDWLRSKGVYLGVGFMLGYLVNHLSIHWH